jgi:hypothetical protein
MRWEDDCECRQEFWQGWLWPIWSHYLHICLERVRKTTKISINIASSLAKNKALCHLNTNYSFKHYQHTDLFSNWTLSGSESTKYFERVRMMWTTNGTERTKSLKQQLYITVNIQVSCNRMSIAKECFVDQYELKRSSKHMSVSCYKDMDIFRLLRELLTINGFSQWCTPFICQLYRLCLQQTDYITWVGFRCWLLRHQQLHTKILFTDENTFNRDRMTNTWNSHVWSLNSTHVSEETHFHSCFSINTWCGVIGRQVTRPSVLEEH